MSVPEAIGSAGVALLLAFFLNLRGQLDAASRSYQLPNLFGAGMSCYASWMIGFMPFVGLEGVWCAVAAFALMRGGGQALPGSGRCGA